ncbi:unnamed protein product [Ixodes pacificus]
MEHVNIVVCSLQTAGRWQVHRSFANKAFFWSFFLFFANVCSEAISTGI